MLTKICSNKHLGALQMILVTFKKKVMFAFILQHIQYRRIYLTKIYGHT